MSKIFISYRREDAQWPARSLHEALRAAATASNGDVFMDIDNIPLGVNFVDHIDGYISKCDVLLALIGPLWLSATGPDGLRRLEDPADFVRIEIATALRRNISVVPVLLDGAAMPRAGDLPVDLKELAVRNGIEVRHTTFQADVARLIHGLGMTTNKVGSGISATRTAPTPPALRPSGDKIVLAEDDDNFRELLTAILLSEGYAVEAFPDGHAALTYLQSNAASIGIFDLRMPRMDGFELLSGLRKFSSMPVIILTSQNDEVDEIVGLKIGADDYIRKPCSERLLLERVKTLLRRSRTVATAQPDGAKPIERGRLTLDPETHACTWDNKPVPLTITEFLILRALAERPGFVKSRDQLMDAAYDDLTYVDDRTIEAQIRRIRRQFRAVDSAFHANETV